MAAKNKDEKKDVGKSNVDEKPPVLEDIVIIGKKVQINNHGMDLSRLREFISQDIYTIQNSLGAGLIAEIEWKVTANVVGANKHVSDVKIGRHSELKRVPKE